MRWSRYNNNGYAFVQPMNRSTVYTFQREVDVTTMNVQSDLLVANRDSYELGMRFRQTYFRIAGTNVLSVSPNVSMYERNLFTHGAQYYNKISASVFLLLCSYSLSRLRFLDSVVHLRPL